jgi:FAD/FMN-containing dehydrogenase
MRISRRTFLKGAGTFALVSSGCTHLPRQSKRVLVNDVQSRLNETCVERIVEVQSLTQLESAIKRATETARPVSVCGGRHAMGGQQFLADCLLLDTTRLRRVLKFEPGRGIIEVEAGIQWPELLKYLLAQQNDPQRTWTFAQKQTGANRFCLGGALGSNIHSRCLSMKPIISDI